MALNRKQAVRYAVMPGIVPRMREIFTTGFSFIPYFMALVYSAVRLLPTTHPYTQAQNIGKFGIRHVIAEAANNLDFKRENIDQIIVFGVILIGLGLTIMQFVMLGFTLFLTPAIAQMPTSFAGFFISPSPDQDLAGMMMDMVFGVPGIFNSCVSTATICGDTFGNPIVNEAGEWVLAGLGFPYPIHFGLHALLRLYSIALLVVATMITIYFVFTIIAETAQTGTPFGRRYNKLWAPIRILVAFGLLVPLGPGLNGSQYIVLYAAKYGSGFASNGWSIFNRTLSAAGILQKENLLSQPGTPEVSSLLQFMFTASTCQYLEQIKPTNEKEPLPVEMYVVIDPLAAEPSLPISFATTYEQLLDFVSNETKVIIRFGQRSKEEFPQYKGYVYPTCGEITLTLNDPRDPNATDLLNRPEPGTRIMQEYYWYVLKELWFNVTAGITNELFGPIQGHHNKNYTFYYASTTGFAPSGSQPNQDISSAPDPEYRSALNEFYRRDLNSAMTDPSDTGLDTVITDAGDGALAKQRESERWILQGPLLDKGWAGAAIWYNRIAEMNGAMTTAALSIPLPSKYPAVMEHVAYKKSQQNANMTPSTRFEPKLSNDQPIPYKEAKHKAFADALWQAYSFFQQDGGTLSTHVTKTGNAFYDALNSLFGTEGLYDMRKNENVHPLAQVVGIGKSLIEASIRNFGYSTLGAATALGPPALQGISKAFIGFLMTIATITMTAGFVLFYVVPFMPFVYFFFAVSGWVKGIFEAMAGAPLWALAHIRIDGEGLPGQAAAGGYFLIFEIFLRPILIVFGLLASISIFGAMVNLLNETWDLVTANLSGFDPAYQDDVSIGNLIRGPVDEFFFTLIYAIVVYLMGLSSFKLIDLIPKSILRWMGQSVQTFNDEAENPAEGLASRATIGGSQVFREVGGQAKSSLSTIAGGGS